MNYYLDSGYVNIPAIIAEPYPFQFLIHGRGTGKTYGALEYVIKNEVKFVYMRRSQTESDLITSAAFSPFKPLMDDNQDLIIVSERVKHVKNLTAVYRGELGEDGKAHAVGEALGYCVALSTVRNIRGFSMEDCEIVIYDEFIPEGSAKKQKGEDDALLNAYETINRNRELKGKPPLKLLALSNANNIAAPIFATLGIMREVEKLAAGKKDVYRNAERGIAVYMLHDSPISAKKADTALYRATRGTSYANMAIDNAYDLSNWLYVGPQPIAEYKPIAVFDDICIYRHKSDARRFYAARLISGNPPTFLDEPMSKRKAKRFLFPFFEAWLQGTAYFQDYYCKWRLTTLL